MPDFNILICVDLSNHSKKIISDHIRKIPFLRDTNVTILNGVEQSVIFDTFTATLVPSEDQFEKSIKEPILKELKSYASQLKELNSIKNVQTECILFPSIKKATCDYINKNYIDLVIVANESKSALDNLFSSSFTDFIIHHTKASVLVCK